MDGVETKIFIWVQPGARASQIIGWEGETLRVRVQAPAKEGRANEALLQLLAEVLGLPKGHLAVAWGVRSRKKLVTVVGLDAAQVRARLEASGFSRAPLPRS